MKLLPAVLCLCVLPWASPARAAPKAPVRLALVVGQDVGAPEDTPLQFAESDAKRFYDVLTTIGDVSRERTYLILDASADRVRAALGELRGRAAELVGFGQDPILIVYVSSHADSEALHLGPTRLRHAELRELLAAIPARVRVVLVDACASGALIRRKGGRTVTPFSLDLEQRQTVEGEVIITSAGAAEPAQEWDALAGSLFTHHLLSALRGAADRDGDGRVTLFEAYGYTYERTVAASVSTSAGGQHPVQEIDLRGEGDLPLTRPGSRREGLEVGATLAGHFVVTTAVGGELVAAFDKSAGRPMRLVLPAGRYLVRKPEGRFVRVGEVLVSPGATTALDESAMERMPYAQVARKGARLMRPRGVEVGFGLWSGTVAGQPTAPRVALGLRREWGPWEASGGVNVGGSSWKNADGELHVEQREAFARAELRWRLPVQLWLPYAGFRLGGGYVHQTFTREQEDEIRRVFNVGPLPARKGFTALGHVTLGIEIPMTGRISIRTEGFGGLYLPHLDGKWSARPGGGVEMAGVFRW